MAQTKTDNSFIVDKVNLRAAHLPMGEVHVLDCFAGEGIIWRGVAAKTKRNIIRLPIDTRDEIGFHLPGDNLDYLLSLDLERFNAIDLDAYGIPCEQISILVERGFQGWVYATFIQSLYGIMPYRILEEIGFSREMIEKVPTLFGKLGWDYFRQWLALKDVGTIWHRSYKRKHYLAFQLC